MHILELPSFFLPHGGLFCLEQAKALKAMGHEVRIVSIVELGISSDKAFYLTAPLREERREMDGVEVISLYMRAMPKAVRWNTSHWVSLCEAAVERYVGRYGKPDILHAHCCKNAGLAARRIASRLQIPFFVTEHLSSGLFRRDFGEGWKRHGWLKEALRETYEAAACVIPVCSELVDDLAPYFGKAYRHEAVSNIVDTDFFAFRERSDRQGRAFRFCCLAVADIHGKGYDVLAEAMRHVPEDVELYVAGRGTDSSAMQRLFAGSPATRLLGHIDKADVRQLLWQSDALVLPSRSEAQPLVLLEALSTGIPAVTTECIPPSVRLPEGVLFAPVGDARGLADKMCEALEIKPSRSFHERVESIASPEVVARKLTSIFQQTDFLAMP